MSSLLIKAGGARRQICTSRHSLSELSKAVGPWAPQNKLRQGTTNSLTLEGDPPFLGVQRAPQRPSAQFTMTVHTHSGLNSIAPETEKGSGESGGPSGNKRNLPLRRRGLQRKQILSLEYADWKGLRSRREAGTGAGLGQAEAATGTG